MIDSYNPEDIQEVAYDFYIHKTSKLKHFGRDAGTSGICFQAVPEKILQKGGMSAVDSCRPALDNTVFI